MKKRLDVALAARYPDISRSKAQAMIMAHQVLVDGVVRSKPGTLVAAEEAEITLKATPKYVSRAGEKLASVAEKFQLDFQGKTVLDVGSSTGGFSDFALQNGAKTVYAVDVGTNQLHWRLRQDERVVVMEKTDIRSLFELPHCCQVALIDVSFISIRKVLPHVEQLLCANGQIAAMVKPQFEASKKEADLNKGVIKNEKLRREILKQFELWAKEYFIIKAKADSQLAGSKGNVERFYLLEPLKR